MNVRAIQITKDRFFCPRDWLASCQFRRPPSNAPTPKLMMQITSDINAMVARIGTELEFSFCRKLEALALMINRLSNQIGNENRFPLRTTVCAFGESRVTARAKSNGTNITINTGSKTSQTEI